MIHTIKDPKCSKRLARVAKIAPFDYDDPSGSLSRKERQPKGNLILSEPVSNNKDGPPVNVNHVAGPDPSDRPTRGSAADQGVRPTTELEKVKLTG
jgi:hypothetical protein